MLKSFEFIDPVLAKRIKNLEEQLKKSEQGKQQILNNKKLNPSTREKLVKFQEDCSKKIESMLTQEKDKLAQYLDEQTNVITKNNRLPSKAHNLTLNQSTGIDFSIVDDSKSDLTVKTIDNRRVSSFYLPATTARQQHNGQHGNKYLLRIKRLKKQVSNQSKLIKMLVSWIKIYHEREQGSKQITQSNLQEENAILKKENGHLFLKCKQLEDDITRLRIHFKDKAFSIMQTQRKYEQIKEENAGLMIQRKEMLQNARSLKKPAPHF